MPARDTLCPERSGNKITSRAFRALTSAAPLKPVRDDRDEQQAERPSALSRARLR